MAQCFLWVTVPRKALQQWETFTLALMRLKLTVKSNQYSHMFIYSLDASFDACKHLESAAGTRSLGQACQRRRLLGSRRWRRRRRDATDCCRCRRRHASSTAIGFTEYRAVPRRASSTAATHRLRRRDPIRHASITLPHLSNREILHRHRCTQLQTSTPMTLSYIGFVSNRTWT